VRDTETIRTGLRVELFVDDPARSAAFYVDVLGFEIIRADPSGYISIGRSGAVIGLNAVGRLPHAHPIKPGEGERRGLGVEIVVMTGGIEAAHAQATAASAAQVSPLVRQPWGLTDFRVLDPDGYYVRLTSLSSAA
jgi:catechol 2,3-dioxygenase-like lactoylglutathione lyase family enzyme